MARFLGIDYGTKYTGLAISDESGKIAFPLTSVSNAKNLLAEILRVGEEKRVSEIILGESRNFHGKENPVQEKILTLKKELEERGFTVRFEPEFLTSAQARKLGSAGSSRNSRDKHDDASAAALILQSYLDKQKNYGHHYRRL